MVFREILKHPEEVMRTFMLSALLAVSVCLPALPRFAGPADELIEGYFAELKELAAEIVEQDALLELVMDANDANNALDNDDIAELDQKWIDGDEALHDAVLSNALTDFLKARIEAAGGRIGEIIVMDDKGLNVAAWPATSDYLQGDEDKFQKTYDSGTGAVRGQRIGAITIGLDIAHSPEAGDK
jgi:hypothetical protein